MITPGRRHTEVPQPPGLLVAFTVTTMVMVVGVAALALLPAWWVLVPVVVVHWIATYVILARINALLSE